MSGLPSYDEAAGSSHGPPPSHEFNGAKHATAGEEKAQMAAAMAQSVGDDGDKVLKIWHAASGNSLITAADEQTPIYNIIDSRAPNEADQRQQSAQAYDAYHARSSQQQTSQPSAPGYNDSSQAGMTRTEPHDEEPADVQFARQIYAERNDPYAQGARYADIWHLTVRRGGDRNSEPIALIKRHINTKSAVGIDLHGVKTGIEQISGFPHTKYVFKWHGREFNWTKTHKAPGTNRLDSGNYVCRDAKKKVYAYATAEDARCDGSMQFENCTIEEGLLDLMTITAFVMRDLDGERRTPRYNGAYGAGAYGPYGNPYLTSAYGYYPIGYGYGGFGMPLLF